RVIFETAHLISHGHPHHLSPRTLARTSRRCASACSSSAQQLGSSSVSRVVICRYRVAASIRSRMTPASSALVGIPSQAWTQAAMRYSSSSLSLVIPLIVIASLWLPKHPHVLIRHPKPRVRPVAHPWALHTHPLDELKPLPL